MISNVTYATAQATKNFISYVQRRGGSFVTLKLNGAAGTTSAKNTEGQNYSNSQGEAFNRDAIISAHSELRTKVNGTAMADKDTYIYLSKSDQKTLLAFEMMQTMDVNKSESSYIKNFLQADTFIWADGLASRNFLLEGYGMTKGGEFNYISVGMMAAHYNHSLSMVPVQSVLWNGSQLLFGEGSHNYSQMFTGSFWGGYGHAYYNENK